MEQALFGERLHIETQTNADGVDGLENQDSNSSSCESSRACATMHAGSGRGEGKESSILSSEVNRLKVTTENLTESD